MSFIRIRTPDELSKLINSVSKNKKILTDIVNDEVEERQYAQEQYRRQQAPTLKGLEKISDKIDERLAPIITGPFVCAIICALRTFVSLLFWPWRRAIIPGPICGTKPIGACGAPPVFSFILAALGVTLFTIYCVKI